MRSRRRLLIYLIPLLPGGVLAALWANRAWHGLPDIIRNTNVGCIAGMVALTLVWLFVRFLRWQFLLRRVGVRLPIRPSLAAYLAAVPGTATPGYVGEVARGVFVRRRFGVPLRLTIAVLVLERVFDMAALGALAAITALSARGVAIGMTFVGVAILLALAGRSVAIRVGLGDAARLLFRPSTLVATSASSLVAWLTAALLLWLGARAVNLPLSLPSGVHIFSSATLIGAATLAPAGVGVTGSATIVQLQALGLTLSSVVVLVSLVRLTSVGVALSIGFVFLWRELHLDTPRPSEHFDHIAAEYREQWSPHVWDHLLARKIDHLTAELPPPGESGVGLDLGCGLGAQLAEMGARGYRVIGIDSSVKLLTAGYAKRAARVAGSAGTLPFRDATFDFVYMVGVLHHLPGPESQAAAYREVARVLKPGGRLLVHESNPRNPLFRFYMGYIFPMLKSIDEGTECWIDPAQPLAPPSLTVGRVKYFTFMPDFTPRALMPAVRAIERSLEQSRAGSYAAHYLAVLQRVDDRGQ